MVSAIQYGNGGPTIYVGLHNDPKPENADNGSIIIEMDTSKVFFFDDDNSTWWEWGAESNAESASASTLSMTRPSLTLGNTFSPDVVEPDVMENAVPEMAEEEMPEVADTTEDGEGE